MPRYSYRSPAKPAVGDRAAAEPFFAQGRQAQAAHRLKDAIQAYKQSVQIDPAFYAAFYNLGLASADSGDVAAALPAYESALAIDPASADARCNFALLLGESGYALDAANEFEKVLSTHPKETRAHLGLANLYAQQLGQPAKARQHYLIVLELDSRHPQAEAIRYWLSSHP
jgi:tetratricopeptide (TPR) repeat protein